MESQRHSTSSRRHRHRQESQEVQGADTEPREKKKVKKGILKNGGKHNSIKSAAPQPGAGGEYDVPKSSSGRQPLPDSQGSSSRKSHRNLSGSCGTIDNLDFEPSYSQVKEKSRRRHREVEDVNIYDTPKVTSVKWRDDLAAAYDMMTRAKTGQLSANSAETEPSFYENVGFNAQQQRQAEQSNNDNEGVYDFPRPRNVDTVYFNDNFEDEGPTYDTPRKQDDVINYNQEEDELEDYECDYDIPKVQREATLTPIEEEDCQEYDVPRNNKLIIEQQPEQPEEDDENNLIYENQRFVSAALIEHEPIYMNEIQDDRSSGYRSSSSPSINSEENLYENGAMLLDDFSSQGSQGSQENLIVGLEPGRHDVAIETTHTLERLSAAGSKDTANKKKHEVVTNNKEKHSSSRARTPEEGICLEFEEFNPEVSEKQLRQEKRNKGPAAKKEFNHKPKRDNKEINFFDEDVSVFQKPGKQSEKVSTSDTEGNQTVIYSKPDKKRKGEKFQVKNHFEKHIITSHKGESDEKTKDNYQKLSKSWNVDSQPILEPISDATEELVSSNIKLADKIGMFENKKIDTSTHLQEKKHQKQLWKDPIRTEKLPTLKSSEDLEQAFIVKSCKIIEKPLKAEATKSNAKKERERDRGVEVYMETVRQRSSVRDKPQLTTELFQRHQRLPVVTPDTAVMDQEDPPADTDCSNVGLPSVRKLLARFENSPDNNGDNTEARSKSRIVKSNSIHGEVRANKTPPARKGSHTLYESDSRAIVVPSPSFRAVEKKVSQSSHHHTARQSDNRDDEVDERKRLDKSKHWDPQYFVKSLYKIPALGDNSSGSEEDEGGFISLEASTSCPTIEGYMERLPAGRKKSTMWNSWKKQYFVAKNGVLNIFEDKTQGELLGKFELFGGHIDFMDSNMLGIQDRRGQYIVVRSSTHRAAQEWEAALSFHTEEDYSNTFLCPVPIPRNIRSLSNIIVIDLGGSSVRAGICGPEVSLPQVFFPSIMAVHPRHTHEKYFGFDAIKPEIRSVCKLSHPLLPSTKVDKYSVDLVALCGLLLRVFKDLQVDPKKYELQLSVPRNFNDKTKAAIASLLFDEFEVPAVNMGHQTVFALHSYRTDTGIVVDIGERMDVVPIVAGYKVQSGISRTTTGGGELVTHMKHALLGHNYSLTSDLDNYVVKQVVESLCYIPKNYDAELEKYKADPSLAEKSLAVSEDDSSHITIGLDRFEVSEGIFKPDLWGLDQAGIHVLVKKAVAECSLDVRKEVSRSIFLSGGATMMPGFNHRLEAELEKLLPVRPKVHASPYRYHAAFLGASHHANTEDFTRLKIRREDWVSGKAKNMASLWVL